MDCYLSFSHNTMSTESAGNNMPTDSDLGEENRLEQSFRAAREHRGPLFGRKSQVEQLRKVYRRFQVNNVRHEHEQHLCCRSELVIVQGASGTGKSALVHSIEALVEQEDGGYFVRVTFDSVEGNEPYQALVEALTDFIQRVIGRGDCQALKLGMQQTGLLHSQAYDRLEKKFPLLRSTDEFEDLELSSNGTSTKCLDLVKRMQQTTCSPLEKRIYTGEGCNALKDALCLFVESATFLAKPIVLMLDDLHWANECFLDLLRALIESKGIRGVLFVCTMTSEASVSTEKVDRAMNKLREADVHQTRLALLPMAQADIHSLVSRTLSSDPPTSQHLASLLTNYSKGNVALIWEALRLLHANGILQVSHLTGQCTWANEDVHVDSINISVAMRCHIENLTVSEVEGIKHAACLGVKLDFHIISRLMNWKKKECNAFAHHAAQLGVLVYDVIRKCWCFSSATLKKIVYELIPDDERPSYHYQIGCKLRRTLDVEELTEFIFLVVEQLTFRLHGLTEDEEKTAVAKLYMRAGVRAFHLSSFYASIGYLECGISLLDSTSWKNNYALSLDLHSSAAEVANALGQFEKVFGIVASVISNAQVYGDSLRARATLVHALGGSGKHADAMKQALEVLDKLGEPLPKPSHLRAAAEFMSLKRRLKAKSTESILRLPHMLDTSKLAAMQMMNLVILYGYIGHQALVPLVGFRMVNLTLDHGLCTMSCVGFILFAGLLCGYDQRMVVSTLRISRL
jgi:predicted ATPase